MIAERWNYANGSEYFTMRYTFDETGSVIGFSTHYPNFTNGYWEDYLFAKNLQGDVVAMYLITVEPPRLIATYEYDEWGKVKTVRDATGAILTDPAHLANRNPFRYRSYHYDTETGFYYLQSRYYDPVISRFINADSYASTGHGFIGTNMFTYCLNNPINYMDDGGSWPKWIQDVVTVVAVATAVVVTAVVLLPSAPAAVCAGTLMLMEVGLSYTVASTAAAATVTIFMTAITAYFADKAYMATTGESLLLNEVFRGNQAAYEAFQIGVMIAMAGFSQMANVGNAAGVCFIAGTLVQTKNGEKPIEEIKVGDYVWAYDEYSKDTALKQVVETYVNETDELTHIFVNGEEIICTPTHPFYNPVKDWTDAVHLRAGDILVLVNGEYVVVEKVQHELLENPVKVYNFQVEDYHTYYVSESGVLVHNSCRPKSPAKIKDNYIDQNDIDAHAFKHKAGGIPNNKISRYDIYRDKANKGKLWIGSKDGKTWIETDYYFEDLEEKWKK